MALTEDHSGPDTTTQQSILQQARAAATAEDLPERSRRQETFLENTDLVTPDTAEDEVPPPAYGDVYGEIRNEKEGLGSTVARVANDGRVNIRINHLNRRLSQVFTPALQQHVQSVQVSQPPPPPYIPPGLGGKGGVAPPPPMNVVIQIVGSRGDVQPFIALGKVLKNTYGHRVRLATHPTFKHFVQENGLDFFSIGGDPSRLMAFMVKNPGLMPSFRSMASGDVGQQRKGVAEYIQGCWRSCYQASDGMSLETAEDDTSVSSGHEARPFVADCIIANPPSFAHVHCAEKLGIPLHIMFTMPYSSTQAFPHPLANIQSSNADPHLTNYLSYAMIELLSWQGVGDIINRFRAKCLGLDPVSLIWAPGMLERLKVPHTYCWSPALIPKPKDWGAHISISGFNILKSEYTPPPDLQAFLDAGPPPIYIGFGSIVLDDPIALTALIFEAIRRTGQRVLLSRGWGGIGADEGELGVPEGVFLLGNVPHDWLFQHVSCVVHHGGAGTTAAGIAAGRPTLVIPFFGDQPFWGAMVARAGAGPDPIPYKQLTADNLATAIESCLTHESLARTKGLASQIAAERGSDTSAQLFHQYLEVDRLRCTLAPSRIAVWRIKRTQIRLSAFAACTLANAGLLDFHDLKLFRAQEYNTDEGPWDPISGSFTASLGVLSSITMGLIVDFPSETWKALRMPYDLSRRHSQASASTSARESESLHSGKNSRIYKSPKQSETSLVLPELSTAGQSPPTSSTSGNAICNVRGPGKDYDMMRPTIPHTSKGIGRFAKTVLQSPMTFSVTLTKGMHNVPRLWGDDTVRPQERVTDLKSGVQAVGKEFGYGMYDGITGLFTQPWQGARKEGVTGFAKGMGKGMAGIVAKPGAAALGVLGHSMKGVHKEVQRMFGNNVQNYIITSRTAQGYEEWLQSSDSEKQDVIDRWKLVQKYLKKKRRDNEMVRDVLAAQQQAKLAAFEANPTSRPTTASAPPVSTSGSRIDGHEDAISVLDSTSSSLHRSPATSEETLQIAESTTVARSRTSRPMREDVHDGVDLLRGIQGTVIQLQQQRQEATEPLAELETLRHTLTDSEVDSQLQAREALECEDQLNQVMAQSMRSQRQDTNCTASGSIKAQEETRGDSGQSRSETGNSSAESAGISRDIPAVLRLPLADSGHLSGTMRHEFESQQKREKSSHERTEEQIVLEYIKKQSLLESHHRSKGKSRTTDSESADHDLQRALTLSIQEGELVANRGGESSR